MSRPRYPRQAYERWWTTRQTPKQRIHELLRSHPTLAVEQLAQAAHCPRSYARIWRRNFFAPGYPLPQPADTQTQPL